jgi:hypothetical protein
MSQPVVNSEIPPDQTGAWASFLTSNAQWALQRCAQGASNAVGFISQMTEPIRLQMQIRSERSSIKHFLGKGALNWYFYASAVILSIILVAVLVFLFYKTKLINENFVKYLFFISIIKNASFLIGILFLNIKYEIDVFHFYLLKYEFGWLLFLSFELFVSIAFLAALVLYFNHLIDENKLKMSLKYQRADRGVDFLFLASAWTILQFILLLFIKTCPAYVNNLNFIFIFLILYSSGLILSQLERAQKILKTSTFTRYSGLETIIESSSEDEQFQIN